VVNLEQSDFDVALSLFLCSNGKDCTDEKDQSQRCSARRHQTGVHIVLLEYEFGNELYSASSMPDRETFFITGFPGFIANRLMERLARKDCNFILLVQPLLA